MMQIRSNAVIFSEAFYSVEVRRIFNGFNKKDLDALPSRLFAEKKGKSNELIARFELSFFENRITTYFRKETHFIELSKVLKVISKIYTKNSPSLKDRAVLNLDKSSKLIQKCDHLFNSEFAEIICPLMGYERSGEGLLKGINSLYIGRCILGLGKSINARGYTYKTHESEFVRIANLITRLGPVIYSAPLL